MLFRSYNPRKKGRGVSSGLGIKEFFGVLFEANELLPCNRKMTDTTIAKRVIDEFPKRAIVGKLLQGLTTVNTYRNKYNKKNKLNNTGALYSHRWTIDGEIAQPRTGKPATQAHLDKLRQEGILPEPVDPVKVSKARAEVEYAKIRNIPNNKLIQ